MRKSTVIEGEDDGQRLASLVAMESPTLARSGLAHHHDLGAARRIWVIVSPLAPVSARVITIV